MIARTPYADDAKHGRAYIGDVKVGARRTARISALVAVTVLAGCSGDGVAPMPDAPVLNHLSLFHECGTSAFDEATGVVFPDTFSNTGSAFLGVYLQNDGPGTIPSADLLDWSISGSDAVDFMFGPDLSAFGQHGIYDCSFHVRQGVSLGIGDRCKIRLMFKPSAEGVKTATLSVVYRYQQIVNQTFTLQASAVAPPPNLYTSVPEVFVDVMGSVRIINNGISTIDLGGLVVIGPFLIPPNATNCPAQLTPGGACDIGVALDGSTMAACPVGELTTTTAAFKVPIRTWGTPPIPSTLTVDVDSSFGSVEIDPLGQTCSAPSCSYSLPTSDPLTLTAIPMPGAHFIGWYDANGPHACGTSLTCTIAGTADVTMKARFASSTALSLAITITGTGNVANSVSQPPCSASCTRWVEPGTPVILTASQGTFNKWSGDCNGPSATCNLGTVIANRAVTAAFAP